MVKSVPTPTPAQRISSNSNLFTGNRANRLGSGLSERKLLT